MQFAGTTTDHDGARRAESAIDEAEDAFEDARKAYDSGNVEKGDAALEQMTKALDTCVTSLEAAHKARFFKKAELRVANLQRRMTVLLEDIELPRRGWAEQTSRQLDQIHDKLLAGALRK